VRFEMPALFTRFFLDPFAGLVHVLAHPPRRFAAAKEQNSDEQKPGRHASHPMPP
jgi:hypothetical protein